MTRGIHKDGERETDIERKRAIKISNNSLELIVIKIFKVIKDSNIMFKRSEKR